MLNSMLNSKDPGAKLDLKHLQQSWKNMSVGGKKVFSDMFRKKKRTLARSLERT
jgi:hypothetical protein